MDTTAKRSLSLKLNKIFDQHDFFRMNGEWEDNTLHIGIQPRGFLDGKTFSDKKAQERFNKIIKEAKKLPEVVNVKAKTYHISWHSMSGIEVTIKPAPKSKRDNKLYVPTYAVIDKKNRDKGFMYLDMGWAAYSGNVFKKSGTTETDPTGLLEKVKKGIKKANLNASPVVVKVDMKLTEVG